MACLAASVVAYGAHPFWAQYPHGIAFILFTRRLQWPLLAVVVVFCLLLLALIISGRRRAWWLIGLSPVLALLLHRFALDPDHTFLVNSQPIFVGADQASFVADDDWVVGLENDGNTTAYPFAALYSSPLVVQADQFSPMLLMWSPFANRALAVGIDRSIKARELEIVSMPANTLIVYNMRVGQFINGITGRTMNGQKPEGFTGVISTTKTTWKQWRALHPQSRVLVPLETGANGVAPNGPVLPYFPMPKAVATEEQVNTVALVCTTRPCAVLDRKIGLTPVNVSSPPDAILLFRDSATGQVNAFDRQLQGDLFPLFRAHASQRQPSAAMIDTDSNSSWTTGGLALDGPLKGQRLHPLNVDDGVYLSVLRVWYPDLPILSPMALPPPTAPVREHAPTGRRRRLPAGNR